MPPTRILSLDLDDTLWPVAPVIAAAEESLYSWLQERHPRAAHGHSVESMRALRARSAEQFPDKNHDLTFLRRHALARQFAAAGLAESLADEALEVFLAARNRVDLYADVRPALTRLRARYRLFALSNGNADLERCGLGALFDGHINARSAGAAKPDARIFAQLLRAAGCSAAETLHIGDDPEADVAGAVRAGIPAVWLNRDSRPWPAHLAPPARTIMSLAEIT
jgi:putative hydrolase of the HAD superfamily